jgi:hypothetical protein
MAAAITEAELRRRSPEQIAEHIAALHANGSTARQVLIALAGDAVDVAEDGLERIHTWLRDGWNGDLTEVSTTAPGDAERDRQLLAVMTAFTNAASLVGAIRTRAHIARPDGWDPLT